MMNAEMLKFKPAGAFIRFIASLVDAAILWISTSVILIPLALLEASYLSDSGFMSGVFFVLRTVINLVLAGAYVGYFYSRKGATPGKSVFHLKVLHADTGAYPSLWQAVGRDLVGKFLSSITFFLGYLIIPFRADKRGLHDILFSTRVVRRSSLG